MLKIKILCPNTTWTKNEINAVLPTPDSPMTIIGIWEIALCIIKHILKKLSNVIL